VVLSDREIAWEPDQIHVTPDLIALNVDRMLGRYLPGPAGGGDDRAPVATRSMAEKEAVEAREKAGDYAREFFAINAAWSDRSPAFAFEHSRFLLGDEKPEEALAALAKCPVNWEPLAVGLLSAEIQLRLKRPDLAISILTTFLRSRLRSRNVWELLVRAHAENGDVDSAIATAHQSTLAMPGDEFWVYLNLGRALCELDAAKSAHFFELILENAKEEPWIQLEIADFMMKHKRFDPVRKILKDVVPENAWMEERFTNMRALLAVV
jgi:tetratricopeptide (TPR) repeat protein